MSEADAPSVVLRELAVAAIGAVAGREAREAMPLAAAVGPVDPADEALLLDGEHAYVAAAGPRRRAEFASGRRLLRVLLAQLPIVGVPDGRIPIGRCVDGRPELPTGVLGSVAHADGLVAAVVGRVAAGPVVTGLGVDLERCGALPCDDAVGVVHPDDLAPDPDPTLVLVIKEAAFKAWAATRPPATLAPGAPAADRPAGFLDLRLSGPVLTLGGHRAVRVHVAPGGPDVVVAFAVVAGRWFAVAAAG